MDGEHKSLSMSMETSVVGHARMPLLTRSDASTVRRSSYLLYIIEYIGYNCGETIRLCVYWCGRVRISWKLDAVVLCWTSSMSNPYKIVESEIKGKSFIFLNLFGLSKRYNYKKISWYSEKYKIITCGCNC